MNRQFPASSLKAELKDGGDSLAARKTERNDIRVDAVFDIETANWTEFVCGGVYYSNGDYDAFDFRQEEEFFDRLLAVRGPNDTVGNVWSHNGGRFDIKWALDWAVRRKISCDAVSAGSNIICATVGEVRFLDSKALTKISLEDLTKGASVAKEKLGLQCVGIAHGCTEEEGECRGYCAIRRDMPRALFARLLDYLRADCHSLYVALQKLREYAEANDLDLGMSVGSAAWKNAKRLLELPRAKLSSADHMFARQGYFGGRVPICRPKSPRGYEYDVNSMYPSRLAYYPVPVGPSVRIAGDDCARAFGTFPGVYRARVHVPRMHIPPLPVRVGTRICYPVGHFSGSWTSVELQHAEQAGVKIQRFEEALIWREQKVLFKPWVDKLFALRAAALGWDGKPDKKGPIGTFLKYYANSLTGKFGARPDTEKVRIAPSIEEIEEHACICAQWMLENGTCRCGAWKQLDDAGNIYAEPRFFLQPCAHVEWCAFLTGEARVEWRKQAVSVAEGWDVCYGDTDSLFTEKPRTINIGKELGQWDAGDEWENLEVFAPKVYRLDSKKDALPKVKAKGIRLPQAAHDAPKERKARAAMKAEAAIRAGVAVGKDAIVGFRAGARKGAFFVTDNVKRRINVGYGDRILDGDVTRAPTWQEAVDRWGPKNSF